MSDTAMHRAAIPALGAAALSLLAAVVAQLDHDEDIVPFFAALTVAALGQAWLLGAPRERWRRVGAWAVAGLWLVAAVWIGGLLLMHQIMCACSMPAPIEPERTYLALTATVYHLVGVYGGLVLASLAAWLARVPRETTI